MEIFLVCLKLAGALAVFLFAMKLMSEGLQKYAGSKLRHILTKITGKPYIEDSDYVDNITWAGTISGTDEPVYIVLKNALSLNGLNLAVADKAEAVLPITLTAHYDRNDLENPPYEIIYPNRA